MKTTIKLILASLVLAFASCEKEQIFEPVEEMHEVDESVKATARIGPKLSLRISQISDNAPYQELRVNKTVRFNGSFWSVEKIFIYGNTFSKLWSSPDGVSWQFRKYHPFPSNVDVREMVVHEGKIFAITTSNTIGTLHIYSSRDGLSWSLVSSSVPFSILTNSGAVSFDGKIFVFAWADYSASDMSVYSSPDGIEWTTENENAFPIRLSGRPIVLKDTLYYLGGFNNGTEPQNTIFKSTNGSDWSEVSSATPNYLNPTEDFPAKSNHAVVVHNNIVWVTGWGGSTMDEVNGNDIWYSGDMENWRKYTGHVNFKALSNATMLSDSNRILLLGGSYSSEDNSRGVPSKYIYSIKPKFKVYAPVDIPRDRPKFPRY